MKVLLKVEDLQISFYTKDGLFPAVDGVSFNIHEGENLCIVGESGSGKTVTALAMMRLLAQPPAKYTAGKLHFLGQDLMALNEGEMRKLRGESISMIFQEPMTSLNPVLTVGEQIIETLIAHQKISRKEARIRAVEMLSDVGFPEPEKRIDDYPHLMSGGMRQRVMIAIALVCQPRLLIADEPTTALDVTIQAQILQLMKRVKKQYGMTIMFIMHDLAAVAQIADRVLVLYAGKIMEQGSVKDIFTKPQHPYTRGLIHCIPRIDKKVERLNVIEGIVPALGNFPIGCRFSTRCPFCTDLCVKEAPPLHECNGAGHSFYCHYAMKEEIN